MRGRRDPQVTMMALVDLEERVPKDHPLRTIKAVADEALERLAVVTDSQVITDVDVLSGNASDNGQGS